MVNYFDIHTHCSKGILDCIYNLYSIRAGIICDTCNFPYSYGIHPYDVNDVCIDFDKVLGDKNLKAIGEIGLDFRFQGSAKKQVECFKFQLNIALKNNLPIILHVVKSLPQVLEILKKTHFELPFIVHGFRGSLLQAEKIINQGGLISISPKYPSCTKELFNMFKSYILLETDESQTNIIDHYRNIAQLCEKELNEFQEIIGENIKKTGIAI